VYKKNVDFSYSCGLISRIFDQTQPDPRVDLSHPTFGHPLPGYTPDYEALVSVNRSDTVMVAFVCCWLHASIYPYLLLTQYTVAVRQRLKALKVSIRRSIHRKKETIEADGRFKWTA